MASIVYTLLEELHIRRKLLAFTGDNAGNNNTLPKHLYQQLCVYFNKLSEHTIAGTKPTIRFQVSNRIYCLAHSLNRVLKKIIANLNVGTVQEARDILIKKERIQVSSLVKKLRLIVLWIGGSPQHRQHWTVLSPNKTVYYDIDTCWNSTYTMCIDAIQCKNAIVQLIEDFPEELEA